MLWICAHPHQSRVHPDHSTLPHGLRPRNLEVKTRPSEGYGHPRMEAFLYPGVGENLEDILGRIWRNSRGKFCRETT